ncbi:dihydroorotate dehydrogenase electron transfer subunit [Pirellulaceae bacterium SH467]
MNRPTVAPAGTEGVCSPRFEFVSTPIVRHRVIAKDTWQLTLAIPGFARRTLPGQFFMVRIAGANDPLIGRAFALYDVHDGADGKPEGISVVYTVKGKFTRALSKCVAGDQVEIWGPLGNHFSTSPVEHLILVAGGVGQTPMLTTALAALGKRKFGTDVCTEAYAKRVSLCYGARNREYLAGVPEFQSACSDVHIATEDGSMGVPGRVTDVLVPLLEENTSSSKRIVCCGPEPMMRAVSEIAARYGVPCEVSLETPMACGIGICFTCVAKVRQEDGEWDYKRTCMDGPIFPADSIVWE